MNNKISRLILKGDHIKGPKGKEKIKHEGYKLQPVMVHLLNEAQLLENKFDEDKKLSDSKNDYFFSNINITVDQNITNNWSNKVKLRNFNKTTYQVVSEKNNHDKHLKNGSLMPFNSSQDTYEFHPSKSFSFFASNTASFNSDDFSQGNRGPLYSSVKASTTEGNPTKIVSEQVLSTQYDDPLFVEQINGVGTPAVFSKLEPTRPHNLVSKGQPKERSSSGRQDARIISSKDRKNIFKKSLQDTNFVRLFKVNGSHILGVRKMKPSQKMRQLMFGKTKQIKPLSFIFTIRNKTVSFPLKIKTLPNKLVELSKFYSDNNASLRNIIKDRISKETSSSPVTQSFVDSESDKTSSSFYPIVMPGKREIKVAPPQEDLVELGIASIHNISHDNEINYIPTNNRIIPNNGSNSEDLTKKKHSVNHDDDMAVFIESKHLLTYAVPPPSYFNKHAQQLFTEEDITDLWLNSEWKANNQLLENQISEKKSTKSEKSHSFYQPRNLKQPINYGHEINFSNPLRSVYLSGTSYSHPVITGPTDPTSRSKFRSTKVPRHQLLNTDTNGPAKNSNAGNETNYLHSFIMNKGINNNYIFPNLSLNQQILPFLSPRNALLSQRVFTGTPSDDNSHTVGSHYVFLPSEISSTYKKFRKYELMKCTSPTKQSYEPAKNYRIGLDKNVIKTMANLNSSELKNVFSLNDGSDNSISQSQTRELPYPLYPHPASRLTRGSAPHQLLDDLKELGRLKEASTIRTESQSGLESSHRISEDSQKQLLPSRLAHLTHDQTLLHATIPAKQKTMRSAEIQIEPLHIYSVSNGRMMLSL